MILQSVADSARTAATRPVNYFVWILLGYAAVYGFRFFRPLLRYARSPSFRTDLDRLTTLVGQDAEERLAPAPHEERLRLLQKELEEVQTALNEQRLRATVARGAAELEELARLQNGEIPALEQREATLLEEVRTLQLTVRRASTDQLENLSALRAEYTDPLVRQAVSQVASQYPQSHYQRFDLSLLPGFGAYSESLSSARTMAGVFVLLGLLGTMWKLNSVVGHIGAFTRTQTMESAAFLAQMGKLMQEIGGAFTNSIWGVVLMVTALLLVSWVNTGVQRRVTVLDEVISQRVIPALAGIHSRHLPEFTLADVLRSTGHQLDSLNRTVVGLTGGMDQALSALGRRIGEMLQQFGSYQKQYKQLNDWVATLDTASSEMKKAAAGLNQAVGRVSQPIDEMNAVLQEHLKAQAQHQSSGYLERLLTEVRDNLEAGRKEQEIRVANTLNATDAALLRGAAASEALASATQAQTERVGQELREVADALLTATDAALLRGAAASEALASAAQAQTERIGRELLNVADALRTTSGEQIARSIADLQSTNVAVTSQMAESAAAFEQASRLLAGYSQTPTLFAWITRSAIPGLWGWLRRFRSRGASTWKVDTAQTASPRQRTRPLRAGSPYTDPLPTTSPAGKGARSDSAT